MLVRTILKHNYKLINIPEMNNENASAKLITGRTQDFAES